MATLTRRSRYTRKDLERAVMRRINQNRRVEERWEKANLEPIRRLGLTTEEIGFIHGVSVDNGEDTPLETIRRWLRTAISRYEVSQLMGEEGAA
jgi:hypothetical protein